MASQIDCRMAEREDAYWAGVYADEPYWRGDRTYEDYAPAYCVGYCGFAQYAGSFADAERCLNANWLCLKGDSRLKWEEARHAIRAAWRRAEQCANEVPDWASGALNPHRERHALRP